MNEPQKKLRIAIDIRMLGKKRTGDETVFYELTREVLRQDTVNEYFLLTNEKSTEEKESLMRRLNLHQESGQQKIVTLPTSNRFVWNLVTLPRYLKENQIDVFHTQYILPFWLPNEVKIVNHIHDVSFCAYPELISRKDLFFLKLLIPRSLRRSDAIVVPSQFTKEEIAKYYQIDTEKIIVISNALGSEFRKFSENGTSVEVVKEKYQLPEEYILYVGTLQPRKNIPFLLEAFALFHERFPETKLVLVGSRTGHHYDSKIDDAVKRYNLEEEVIFPGYVAGEDLSAVYQGASVFVFPSLYEGFGIPLLEAMSLNVPVVASNSPCLQEIGADGALYFDLEDVDSLVQILYSLEAADAPKEALLLKGKERVNDFSWSESGTKLISLYEKLGEQKHVNSF